MNISFRSAAFSAWLKIIFGVMGFAWHRSKSWLNGPLEKSHAEKAKKNKTAFQIKLPGKTKKALISSKKPLTKRRAGKPNR